MASKVFSIFHVREKGEELYFRVDRSVELLDTALVLRRYLNWGLGGEADFSQNFSRTEPITAEEFAQLAALRMENTGKVAGAFDLDFERQEFSALHILDGWKTWSMADVSAAAYHAFRKVSLNSVQRLEHLLYRLDGREITSEAPEELEDFSATDWPDLGEGPSL